MEENKDETTLDAIIASEPAPAAPAPAPTPEPPITLGRIVHFHEWADVECERVEHRTAIVVQVWGASCCNLLVYGPRGEQTTRTSVSKSQAYGQPMTWSYPPRA